MNGTQRMIIVYVGIMVFAAAVAVWGWEQFKRHDAEWMPIRHVRVEGRFQYLTRNEVKTALMPWVETGFYHIDLAQIKRALKQLAWTDRVAVHRVWPDAIEIEIEEQQPVARWQDRALINDRGELFEPENIAIFDDLPEIRGPAGQHGELLEQMKILRKMLADKGLLLQQFYVDQRRAWQIRLVSGLEIKLGRLLQIKQLQRFLKTVDILEQALIELMVIVDLRYPNGYAVTWKSDKWKQIIEKKKRV